MQIFYVPDIEAELCTMEKTESGHAIRVLRMTSGDRIRFVDGRGSLYEGIIIKPDPNGCVVRITSREKDFEKRDYRLHIAISPLKNTGRFEWFIEKCVETGIDEITPLICKNTEKATVKKERLDNIIVSAMKQSLKAFRPLMNDPADFHEFIGKEEQAIKMIAHCNNSFSRAGITEIYQKGADAVILIGPEADFSPDEIKNAEKAGYQSVHIGKSRFRTETAGIAACFATYFSNR